MKKIVIVMTYFDRPVQLKKTLKSIAESEYKNFEVVIVDDCSSKPPEIGLTPFPVTVLTTCLKGWTNPEPAYNKGLLFALTMNPEVIILQNAECYHWGDVISRASEVTDESYISFGCYSLNEETTFRPHNICQEIELNNIGASRDGQNAWYNHPLLRPMGYDFCSAITAKNMKILNGYDERFSFGCGFGDDYLLERIKMLKLKIEITDNPIVVHQWHYNTYVPANKSQLVENNRRLLGELLRNPKPRAEHLFTQNL
jgi:glycosyltransferase involved in cell wall biosynthesis